MDDLDTHTHTHTHTTLFWLPDVLCKEHVPSTACRSSRNFVAENLLQVLSNDT
jgi:hypothetical protein